MFHDLLAMTACLESESAECKSVERKIAEGEWGRERKREKERRSEEHTSELQSRPHISYAVFCLKKKITKLQYVNIFP